MVFLNDICYSIGVALRCNIYRIFWDKLKLARVKPCSVEVYNDTKWDNDRKMFLSDLGKISDIVGIGFRLKMIEDLFKWVRDMAKENKCHIGNERKVVKSVFKKEVNG